MAPQHRDVVPTKEADRLRAAAAKLERAETAVEQARKERDRAIVAALKAGGSTGEVGKVAGLTGSMVSRIGKENGWPTPEVIAAREARKAENAERRKWWDDLLP